MTRKLAIIAFCFCACFGLVGITYADTYASTTKENTAEQEQEINLDQYLNNGDKSLYDVIYGVSGNTVSNKLLKGRPSKPNANRGYFWVTYEGEKFAAHFDNDYFTHKVSVKIQILLNGIPVDGFQKEHELQEEFSDINWK